MLPPLALGPLVLPSALWLLLLMAAAAAVAMRLHDRHRDERHEDNETLIFWVVLAAALCARIGFVAMYFPVYRLEPGSIFNLRDGGWHAGGALLGAVLALVWLLHRHRTRATSLMLGAASALTVLVLVFASAQLLRPAAPQPLPALSLRFHDGKTRPLRASGPQVINLWASWCPPCRREMPALLAASHDHPNVHFVFVNQGEDAATIAGFLKQHALPPDRLAHDPAQELGRALDVRGLPTTLFVDAQGRIVHRHVGELSRASVAAQVQSLQD